MMRSACLIAACALLARPFAAQGGGEGAAESAPAVPAASVPAASVPAEQASSEPVWRTLIEATHERLVFEQQIKTVAVGRSATISYEVLESREILVLGREPGRTSLTVWFTDGSTETILFSVEPDLSVLRAALRELHPSITAEIAPHRGAVVLRGLVPDVTYLRAAEAAAGAYLSSDADASGSTLVAQGAAGEAGEPGAAQVQTTQASGDGAVINLIRLSELPPMADDKMREALAPLVGESVTVRRVMRGQLPDDTVDLFVLEGSVPDQVTLARTLFLTSRALLGNAASGGNDIRVLADEGGALTDVDSLFGAVGGQGGANQAGLRLPGQGNQGGGGNQGNQMLMNRIGANLGRAKVVEAADGRILAMVDVEHLPLVRIDVQLYEVNLTRLRQWRNDLTILSSDFDQSPLLPAEGAVAAQGGGAQTIGQDQWQDVVGFLGGEFTNQSQYVTGGFAIDNAFSILASEQIARALSRPTLTVLSGELAQFQVGGQVPIPIAVTVGGGTDQILNAVDFRDFGIQLIVRPLVEELDSETITLDLSPIISLPDLDLTAAIGSATGTSVGATAFESRGARTHTRLRDGDAMMIGGLISRRAESALAKTPGLGDIPLAGWLFRNEVEDAEDVELVVVVNPVIVRPPLPSARLWSFIEPADVLTNCLAEVRRPETSADASASQATPSEEAGNPGTPAGASALGG